MKNINKTILIATILATVTYCVSGCGKKDAPGGGDNGGGVVVVPPVKPVKTDVAMWLTSADQTVLFQKQNVGILFSTATNSNQTIAVDTTQTYQTIDGFGFTLTGGSATLINGLPETQKAALLTELFATDTTHIGISYLRVSIGASDLSSTVFSYDDIAGDASLQNFAIDKELIDLVPILKRIIAINPNIKILACPWSAPSWMKDNGSFTGGSLKAQYYDAYANYFVKYIQAMAVQGIPIEAVTPQNEPLNPSNTPAMVMVATDEAEFIKNHLGPAFKTAGIKTKILVYDHNCDHPEYATSILADAAANAYVDGSAFHLYAGDISALSIVHNAYPAKNVYFTEQATFVGGNFGGDLSWHVNNLIIGATRNWSKNVLEWNIASDQNANPHTQGGCSTCLGALTVNGNTVTHNVSYYIVAHASKFVRPGAVRIGSAIVGSLQNVAFKNTDGKKVLIVLNTGTISTTFNIAFNGKLASTILPGGAVATYVW